MEKNTPANEPAPNICARGVRRNLYHSILVKIHEKSKNGVKFIEITKSSIFVVKVSLHRFVLHFFLSQLKHNW